MDKGKGGGFWLEKIPMPADICEQEEVVPEYPGNLRAREELTGMQGRCAENQEQECCDWHWAALPGNPKTSLSRGILI